MAFLPKEALTLKGGCYCEAIRYTITIPALEDRPLIPGALETPITPLHQAPTSDPQTVKTRAPIIDLDHCETCRRVAGNIIQCWLICPTSWFEWDLLPFPTAPPASTTEEPQRLTLSTTEAVGPRTADGSQPRTYVTHFNATERATRSFCSRCGTNLTYFSHKYAGTPNEVVDVTVGSLDEESVRLVRPDRHGWWDFGVEWIRNLVWKGEGGDLIRHQTGNMGTKVEE